MTNATAAPIHPFPARMAPELVLATCSNFDATQRILDPMAGSGTTLRAAIECGHSAVGFDVDPLAVLMTKVWTTPLSADQVIDAAAEVVRVAAGGAITPRVESWRTKLDSETNKFIEYWFGEVQQRDLERIATVLAAFENPAADALRLALSGIIVTKERGASLARDTSHSRPHKVRESNDFDVFQGFQKSATRIAEKLRQHPPRRSAEVQLGDARNLKQVEDGSINAVITSPPYLNAIDYIRGHRLALVWLGWSVGELRRIRAKSIGTERMAHGLNPQELRRLTASMGTVAALPPRFESIVYRYANDMFRVVQETSRVLRPGGVAVFVVGNSSLRGTFLQNDQLVATAATLANLEVVSRAERKLPENRRYLPPPKHQKKGQLDSRMATETVLTLRRC